MNRKIVYVILGIFLNIHSNGPSAWIADGVKNESISPLMKAAKDGDMAVLKGLFKSKVNLTERSASNMTALHYAIGFEKEEAAVFLINHGAPLNVLDKWDNTPLFMARTRKQKRVIEALEKQLLNGKRYQNLTFDDKHFFILIASYNNAPWYEKNLDKLFSQNYSKFTAIYMDDMSSDGTFELVQEYLRKRNLENRVIMIKNKVKRYCLGNYLFAVERFCPNKAVLVTYDGDDWFNSTSALSYLNDLYQNPNTWLTYGNSIIYPDNKKIHFCKPIDPQLILQKKFRQDCKKKIHWPVHHLRSFYAALFRKIKYEDLLDENKKLFTYAEDVAFMLPMIEMAGPDHIFHSDELLYVYNMKNPLITLKRFGKPAIHEKFRFICDKKPYDLIESLD